MDLGTPCGLIFCAEGVLLQSQIVHLAPFRFGQTLQGNESSGHQAEWQLTLEPGFEQ